MKTRNYIIGLTGLMLCAACSNEELTQQTAPTDKIQFGATIQTTTAISARNIGNNKGETEALPYIYGIHIRKMESPTPINNSEYEVLNGNKGTLTLPAGASDKALLWTNTEKKDNTKITFYAWTQPDGVTLDSTSPDVITGTIDFKDDAGNRAPLASNESNIHKINDTFYTPLELFISAVTTGSYKDNPSISLPFTHPIAKVRMEVYNWDNEEISSSIKIQFPFINQTYTIEQEENKAFAITGSTTAAALELDFSKLAASGNYRTFYLPPVTFQDAGDFIITYGKDEKYYGTLNALKIKQLNAGDYMTCRIDLNKNYGTGVGATIENWKYVTDEASANPYQGIYTVEDLKILKDYLDNPSGNALSNSLYFEETIGSTKKKIIRLYNDLILTDESSSLALEKDMIFDGLGHTITVPTGKSLFGDITATGIEINNVRLLGEGQLASSLDGVKVFNCHANGTGHLVGEAKGSTSFDFCSAEIQGTNSTTLIGTAGANNTITVTNSLVASGATAFAGSGTIYSTINSFIIGGTNTYWNNNGAEATFTIADPVTATTVTINGTPTKLIDLLNEASNTINSNTTNEKYWVYVYGKSYPVMRVK